MNCHVKNDNKNMDKMFSWVITIVKGHCEIINSTCTHVHFLCYIEYCTLKNNNNTTLESAKRGGGNL